MKPALIGFISILAISSLLFFPNFKNQLHHFEQQEEYSPKIAYDLATFCTTSYCNPDKLAQWKCGDTCEAHPEMTEVEVIHFSKAEQRQMEQENGEENEQYRDGLAYIAYNTLYRSIVLVFRGTISKVNMRDDAQTKQKNYHLCEIFGITACDVHAGFYKTYNSISDRVHQAFLKKLKDHPEAGLMITGHSLGGAMAIHAAAHIQVFYYNKPFLLYTFGAPRVGDTRFFKFFKTIFKGTNYRITNYRDPVPHVPLQKQGFIHEPTEVFYFEKYNKSVFTVCKDISEDPDCSNKYLLDIAPGKDLTNAEDHMWYMGLDMTNIIKKCFN